MLGKYSYLYDEEEKQRLLKEARDREKAIEKSAFLRLTGGKKTKSTASKSNTLTQSSNTSKSPTSNLSSSMPVLGSGVRSSVSEGENPSDQNEQTSILSKSISEKIDFCYRAISSQYAKLFAQSSSSLLLSKVSHCITFSIDNIFKGYFCIGHKKGNKIRKRGILVVNRENIDYFRGTTLL